jgi:hypothetical protein
MSAAQRSGDLREHFDERWACCSFIHLVEIWPKRMLSLPIANCSVLASAISSGDHSSAGGNTQSLRVEWKKAAMLGSVSNAVIQASESSVALSYAIIISTFSQKGKCVVISIGCLQHGHSSVSQKCHAFIFRPTAPRNVLRHPCTE